MMFLHSKPPCPWKWIILKSSKAIACQIEYGLNGSSHKFMEREPRIN